MPWPETAPQLKLARIRSEAIQPRRMSAQAAGLDLCACLPDGPITLAPSQRMLVPTGWAMAVPAGWEIQIRPRSGLARRQGVTIPNSPGTIDADYRGEVQIILCNGPDAQLEIQHGDRIAQMVVCPVALVEPELVDSVDDLPASGRGSGGFGSTGAR